MTKKEIVRTISEEIGLTQLQTKEIVQKTFDAIVKALVAERRIELRNFGVFEVKRRAPRKARNPRTGDKVFVPEKYVVTFKPGKEMEERVKELERQAAGSRQGRPKDLWQGRHCWCNATIHCCPNHFRRWSARIVAASLRCVERALCDGHHTLCFGAFDAVIADSRIEFSFASLRTCLFSQRLLCRGRFEWIPHKG